MDTHTLTHVHAHMRVLRKRAACGFRNEGAFTPPGVTGLGVGHLLCSPPRPPKDTSDPGRGSPGVKAGARPASEKQMLQEASGVQPLNSAEGKLRPKEVGYFAAATQPGPESQPLCGHGWAAALAAPASEEGPPGDQGLQERLNQGFLHCPLGRTEAQTEELAPSPSESWAELATNPGHQMACLRRPRPGRRGLAGGAHAFVRSGNHANAWHPSAHQHNV